MLIKYLNFKHATRKQITKWKKSFLNFVTKLPLQARSHDNIRGLSYHV